MLNPPAASSLPAADFASFFPKKTKKSTHHFHRLVFFYSISHHFHSLSKKEKTMLVQQPYILPTRSYPIYNRKDFYPALMVNSTLSGPISPSDLITY